jgi:hypothetical protein
MSSISSAAAATTGFAAGADADDAGAEGQLL